MRDVRRDDANMSDADATRVLLKPYGERVHAIENTQSNQRIAALPLRPPGDSRCTPVPAQPKRFCVGTESDEYEALPEPASAERGYNNNNEKNI